MPAGDPQNVARAWAWLDRATKPGRVALLVVPTKGNIDGFVSDAVGERAAKALARGETVPLPSGGRAALMTERTGAPAGWSGGPALVTFGGDDLLDKVEELVGVTEVLAVPWLDEEVNAWVRTWSVSRFGEAPPPELPLVKNPVVVEALKSLVARINTSTGLAHPLDHASAVELFEILRDGGESFEPAEVRAWLAAEGGLEARHANKIREVAQKVRDGKRIKTAASDRWASDVLEQWRREAAARSSGEAT